MQEIFRHRDLSIVKYYQSLLEAEGIPTMVRNEFLTMSGVTEIPIAEMFPNLCVHDENAQQAVDYLREHAEQDAANADEEIKCPSCGELNPGNFDFCFACEEDLGSSS